MNGMDTVHGREAEQRLVSELLLRAQRGVGGVRLLEGEPGIGRSALVELARIVVERSSTSAAHGP
jgi:predicted ATPase